MFRAFLFLALAAAGTLLVQQPVPVASGAHTASHVVLNAAYWGWNYTQQAYSACSPSGMVNCNPTIRAFRGVPLTIVVVGWDMSHNFAVYTRNFPYTSVSVADNCGLSSSQGCLVASSFVDVSQTVVVSFTPSLPLDDFSGPGSYEYYCQLHPQTQHGRIEVLKSPDLTGDGRVSIVDAGALAFSYGTSPGMAKWYVAADLNNDGRIDLLDVAETALYYDRIL